MMEKPLAVSSRCPAMAAAARRGNIHVLVNYETTWYPSKQAAYELYGRGALGGIRKMWCTTVTGPKEISVRRSFSHG